jgi:hypothetical protein
MENLLVIIADSNYVYLKVRFRGVFSELAPAKGAKGE